jgi:hypothetical protein
MEKGEKNIGHEALTRYLCRLLKLTEGRDPSQIKPLWQ